MTNKNELSDYQVKLLVNAYNSSLEPEEPRMTIDEFEPDDLDFSFWGQALLRLYGSLIIPRDEDDKDIRVGKLKISRDKLLKEFWEIAVIMSNDLAVADEVETREVLEPFMKKKGKAVDLPVNKENAKSKLFILANYCFQAGK